MNIGIDISQIAYKGTGVGRFTDGLVRAILAQESLHKWTFYFSSLRNSLDPSIRDAIVKHHHFVVTYSFPPTLLLYVSNHFHSCTKILTKNAQNISELNWFITSDWIEFPMPCKKATIVHDLVFKKQPNTVHKKILDAQEMRLKYISAESNIIFTDSKSTLKDLKDEFDIDESKLVTNYPGVGLTNLPSDSQQQSHLQKFKITSPYLLSVGKQEPRKNIQKLIRVFEKMKKVPADLKLIIVGPDGWDMPKEQKSSIRFLGYVSDEELLTLYAHAVCFVYPSLYEGFGYPIIEAMKHGCPVATSNTSSMPEVAGDAAVYFNPHQSDSMQEALEQLTSSNKLQQELSQKGLLQAQKFTWKQYYNTLISTLEKNSS